MTQHYVPPQNFGMVEEDLYRSGQPNAYNLPFLEKLKLKTVVLLSPDEPSSQLRGFVAGHDVKLVQLGKHLIMGHGSSMSEETVLEALQVLLDVSNYPLLVTCNVGRHHTGTVVGCLRKLQRWNLTSIFEEYRRYASRKVRLLNEQFIEFFDTDLVPLPANPPSWL